MTVPTNNVSILLSLTLTLLLGCVGNSLAQTKSRNKKPPENAQAAQQNAAFDKAVRLAEDARSAGRLNEAVQSYTEALRIRPKWPDGWWYLGAILYEQDLYSQARDAFANLAALEPQRGPVWGMLGLCEFQSRNYERAISALQRGRSLGFDGNKELESVAQYHTALLYVRFEQFEIAYEVLRDLVRVGNDNPRIVEAFGLIILRIPFLPNEIPADKRDEVSLAGQAGLSMAARRLNEARAAFDTLLGRYANDANVHYSFGVFLLNQDGDAALKEFQRALEIDAVHQPSMVQMAFEYLKRDQYNDALPLAEKAVQLAPKMYPARNVLGRVLLELGQVDRAVNELEEGVRLAPSSPEMHFALARAYTRAGRKQEADREREIFKQLQDKDSKQNPAQTGSAPGTNTAKPNPK